MDNRRAQPPLDLAWNPIAFALGQVVISPVLQLANYIPEIQEKLRHSGYPRYQQHELQALQISSPNSPPVVAQATRWLFLNADHTGAISIGSESIVIERSVYSSFDEFSSELGRVINVVQSIVDIQLFERIGFRRINLIEPTDELTLEQMFREGVLGVDLSGKVSTTSRKFEIWADTDVGRMMVRLLRPSPDGVLPPELSASQLSIRPAQSVDSATLDIDHFEVRSAEFKDELVIESLWRLHAAADYAFRQTVSDDALRAWRQAK